MDAEVDEIDKREGDRTPFLSNSEDEGDGDDDDEEVSVVEPGDGVEPAELAGEEETWKRVGMIGK